MSEAHALSMTDRLWPANSQAAKLTRGLVLVALGTALLWASAKVQVPFWPVPMTLQVLAVLLIGAFYGPALAGATLLAYLAEGASGLPVFAGTPEKGLGLAYMVGPTGGYLVGFVVASVVVGALVARGWGARIATMALAAFAGALAIHLCGAAWLTVLFGADKAYGFALGPFLYADLLKIAIAAVAVPGALQLIRR